MEEHLSFCDLQTEHCPSAWCLKLHRAEGQTRTPEQWSTAQNIRATLIKRESDVVPRLGSIYEWLTKPTF